LNLTDNRTGLRNVFNLDVARTHQIEKLALVTKTVALLRLLRMAIYTFGFGGGSSRATHASWKPLRACDPSQKGLFCEWPQRQREITVRPASPNCAPAGS
jgi:hypothetical protein